MASSKASSLRYDVATLEKIVISVAKISMYQQRNMAVAASSGSSENNENRRTTWQSSDMAAKAMAASAA